MSWGQKNHSGSSLEKESWNSSNLPLPAQHIILRCPKVRILSRRKRKYLGAPGKTHEKSSMNFTDIRISIISTKTNQSPPDGGSMDRISVFWIFFDFEKNFQDEMEKIQNISGFFRKFIEKWKKNTFWDVKYSKFSPAARKNGLFQRYVGSKPVQIRNFGFSGK